MLLCAGSSPDDPIAEAVAQESRQVAAIHVLLEELEGSWAAIAGELQRLQVGDGRAGWVGSGWALGAMAGEAVVIVLPWSRSRQHDDAMGAPSASRAAQDDNATLQTRLEEQQAQLEEQQEQLAAAAGTQQQQQPAPVADAKQALRALSQQLEEQRRQLSASLPASESSVGVPAGPAAPAPAGRGGVATVVVRPTTPAGGPAAAEKAAHRPPAEASPTQSTGSSQPAARQQRSLFGRMFGAR
jgi:hypothetical protein